jgi:hypothetical protein
MSKFEDLSQQVAELIEQLVTMFESDANEKACEWDGAVLGSLQAAAGSIRGASNYYKSRNGTFNDISSAKIVKAEAAKAVTEATNVRDAAIQEQQKATTAKVQAEKTIADAEAAHAKAQGERIVAEKAKAEADRARIAAEKAIAEAKKVANV